MKMAANNAELATPQDLKGMNLQLFAEDSLPDFEPEPADSKPDDKTEDKPAPDPKPSPDPKPDPKPEDVTQTQAFAKRLKEETAKATQAARDSFIAEQGYVWKDKPITTEAEYKKALEEQAEETRLAEMVKNNVPEEVAKELLENRKFREDVTAREYDREVEKQKAALKDRPFFAELEPDIDLLIKESKSKGQRIDVEVAYKYLRGDKMEELLSKTKDETVKRTVADMHDRAKRGGAISNDGGGGDDDVDASSVDNEMALAFGNDPKDIAKYVKKQTRR